MRILHYITTLKANDLISDHVRTLTKAMEDMAEIRVITSKDKMDKVIDDMQPDIIHVHVCWNRKAAAIVHYAVKKGIAVVVSPHWRLEPYTMRHEHHLTKLLKSNIYQRNMIQQSEALLVTTDSESKHLMDLGWKKRIHVVKSTILNQMQSAEQQAEETLLFYKKVIDTIYYRLMTDHEKEAIRSLLAVGASQENCKTVLFSNQIQDLQSLTEEQWYRILLYADDEDVREILEKGIRDTQLVVPQIDTSNIARYQTAHPKTKGKLDTTNVREKAVRATVKEEKEICDIAAMLLAARTQLKAHTLSMRHMTELYQAIKYKDYDEDQFVRVVKKLGIRKFTQRILQIICEDFHLTEGFLPMKPRNDSGTEQIRNIVH